MLVVGDVQGYFVEVSRDSGQGRDRDRQDHQFILAGAAVTLPLLENARQYLVDFDRSVAECFAQHTLRDFQWSPREFEAWLEAEDCDGQRRERLVRFVAALSLEASGSALPAHAREALAPRALGSLLQRCFATSPRVVYMAAPQLMTYLGARFVVEDSDPLSMHSRCIGFFSQCVDVAETAVMDRRIAVADRPVAALQNELKLLADRNPGLKQKIDWILENWSEIKTLGAEIYEPTEVLSSTEDTPLPLPSPDLSGRALTDFGQACTIFEVELAVRSALVAEREHDPMRWANPFSALCADVNEQGSDLIVLEDRCYLAREWVAPGALDNLFHSRAALLGELARSANARVWMMFDAPQLLLAVLHLGQSAGMTTLPTLDGVLRSLGALVRSRYAPDSIGEFLQALALPEQVVGDGTERICRYLVEVIKTAKTNAVDIEIWDGEDPDPFSMFRRARSRIEELQRNGQRIVVVGSDLVVDNRFGACAAQRYDIAHLPALKDHDCITKVEPLWMLRYCAQQVISDGIAPPGAFMTVGFKIRDNVRLQNQLAAILAVEPGDAATRWCNANYNTLVISGGNSRGIASEEEDPSLTRRSGPPTHPRLICP